MKKVGKHTLKMDNFITVSETASVVGPKESNGPLKDYFDKCITYFKYNVTFVFQSIRKWKTRKAEGAEHAPARDIPRVTAG